jgi:filamentous hemagglutinin family protein
MSRPLYRLLLTTSALVPLGGSIALANPQGGQVVGGAATIQGQGTPSVIVTQTTPRAIINWQTFNIGVGETTRFVQPNAASVMLNRVVGGFGPSMIEGMLTANGQVYLVNPDGIMIGKDAKIDTASFLATTHDISNADFMAGRNNFTISGKSDASVVNQGTITAQMGGFAALVAPGVRNTGTITANLGKVALASGNGFTLDFYGDRLVTLGVDDSVAAQVTDVSTGKPLKALVSNEGTIKADGGRVELTAVAARRVVDAVINNTGVIEANSIGTRNGMIVLGAATDATKPAGAPAQVVKVSGKLSVAGKRTGTTGGKIQITGENIQLASATLDASGRAGGGKVLIGGDTGGGKPSAAAKAIAAAALEIAALPTASHLSVDAASLIDVSAKDGGDGGKAIVWSNLATNFEGSILARGGAQSGNGGFVETSSHGNLAFSGNVDVAAPKGQSGTLLLDPRNVTIGTIGPWVVMPAAIQNALATGNVIVSTDAAGSDAGDITVAENVSWSNANSLTLSAYRNIAVNANISNTGGAAVNLRADKTGMGVGTVSFGVNGLVSTSGAVSIFYNPSVNPVESVVNATSYVSPTENFSGKVTGGGTLTAYMLVNSVYDLQNMRNNLSGNYALGKDIDASDTAGWSGGAGFIPIGSAATPFNGILNGDGRIVDGLMINSSNDNVGMFAFVGSSGLIYRIGLTNISVTGVGSSRIGGLVSENFGTVSQSFVTGTIFAPFQTTRCCGANLSLLVDENNGVVTQSWASGTVTLTLGGGNPVGWNVMGGLVGTNGTNGSVSQSYATATITGSEIGQLVGWNNGTINSSYAVTSAHGLTYVNWGAITNSALLTSTQLKSGLPPGFDPNIWAIDPSVNNGYPYLKWQTASSASVNTTTLTGASANPPPPSSALSAPILVASLVQTAIPKDAFANGQQNTNFVPKTNVDFGAIKFSPIKVTPYMAKELLPYAVLAADVDSPAGSKGVLFGFTNTAVSWQDYLRRANFSNKIGTEATIYLLEKFNFNARIYKNNDGEIVVAFRSSTNPITIDTLKSSTHRYDAAMDWLGANIPALTGKTPIQYGGAEIVAEAVRKATSSGQITLVGFSKGGGQASYAASAGDKVVTFDAARNPDADRGRSLNQTNVIVANDPIGDPGGLFGRGSLPGQMVTVEPVSPAIVGDYQITANLPFIQGGNFTHSISGIAVGLFQAAN